MNEGSDFYLLDIKIAQNAISCRVVWMTDAGLRLRGFCYELMHTFSPQSSRFNSLPFTPHSQQSLHLSTPTTTIIHPRPKIHRRLPPPLKLPPHMHHPLIPRPIPMQINPKQRIPLPRKEIRASPLLYILRPFRLLPFTLTVLRLG